MPIIADTYQQPAAICIGKGRNRLGKLAGISNTILEVLLLMLALTNEAEKILLVVEHHSHKVSANKG